MALVEIEEAAARAMWKANTPYSERCSWDILQADTHLTPEAKEDWLRMARAAIKAHTECLMEPSEEMIDAGVGATPYYTSRRWAKHFFQAMLSVQEK